MSFEPDDDLAPDDDEGGEFEVNIDPREEDLERRGIDQAAFEEALYAALDAQGDALEASGEGDVAKNLEGLALTIAGKTYRLGDLADVSIDEASDDDDDDDDEEDEIDD